MLSSSFHNPELQFASDYVNFTGCHIFLTGKAGTGKTTFLLNLKKNTAKRMMVTAPTGVAAINAGGVTLHSFFQLPFGPFIPGSESYESNRQSLHRFSKEKKQIIQHLDLLVIDEISMVRADLLDAVDSVLRRYRRSDIPFGGVQLLMIGDLHQLSPVAKQHEWDLLRPYYESVYFFSSHALSQTEWVPIELKHIYRQSDSEFIRLLNRVRDNRLDASSISLLNRRYIPYFKPNKDDGYIFLTTHNAKADATNQSMLQSLKGKEITLYADISGDFPEFIYPTSAELRLKEGAQVMFLRNDSSVDKRYFNGKIGTIKSISKDSIRVVCPGESHEIVVEPVEWENINYSVNPETHEIEEKIIGKFKQYPLKLAWAITIHKSQGLTFDKAIIDAHAAFAHGQVYVALSRLRSFEGLILSSPFPPSILQTDKTILRFSEEIRLKPPSEDRLLESKSAYQQQLLLDCFDLQKLQNLIGNIIRMLQNTHDSVRVWSVEDIHRLKIMSDDIFSVGEKFKRQLRSIFSNHIMPESDAYVLERIGKASVWFQEQFTLTFSGLLRNTDIETDNQTLRKMIADSIKSLKEEIAKKLAGYKACENGFSPSRYLRAISNTERPEPPIKSIPAQQSNSESASLKIDHPELFQNLKQWRSRKAEEEGIAHFQVLHQKVLIQITTILPSTISELRKIKGIGKKLAAKYGEELVGMVLDYRKKFGMNKISEPLSSKTSSHAEETRKRDFPSGTQQVSFDMFSKGMTISQIAQERMLAVSTIEGHLAFFVETGQLDVGKLLSPEKQAAILQKIKETPDISLSEIKKSLGDDYSYGEIKLVMADLKYQDQKN